MLGSVSKYAFINAKLRGRISKILSAEMFSKLAQASSVDAVLALLRDTQFESLAEIYSATGDLKRVEFELLKQEMDLYRQIRRNVHDHSKQVVDALLLRFEVDNLKNALRVFFDRAVLKRSVEGHIHYLVHEPVIHNVPVEAIVNAGSFEAIADLCDSTPYGRIIRQFCPDVQSNGTLFRLEIALDHFYYENMLTCIKELTQSDRRIAQRLIGVEIDLQNISWIMRFKSYYDMQMDATLDLLVPGGFHFQRSALGDLYQSQNITGVLHDFVTDKNPGLTSLLSNAKSDTASQLCLIQSILEEINKKEISRILAGYPFSIGIILAYFVLKQREHAKIRKILIAKHYNRKQQRIEAML